METITGGPITIAWNSTQRVAAIRFASDTTLTVNEANVIIDTLGSRVGTSHEPFAVLADVNGVRGADPEYRAKSTAFFKLHRDYLFIALFNVGPLVRTLAEMFRIGSGLHVKAFATEAKARDWLHERGLPRD